MQKIKMFFSSRIFWMILAIAILALISLSIWLDFRKIDLSTPPKNIPTQTQNTFRGPIGEPHIIGPSGPPPG